MTRDDIKRLAREAGGIDFTNNTAGGVTAWIGTGTPQFIERFAGLVAKEEREACAALCSATAAGRDAEAIEEAIQARGQQ